MEIVYHRPQEVHGNERFLEIATENDVVLARDFDENNNRILQRVDEIMSRMEVFRPNRLQIAINLNNIADRVEKSQRKSSVARIVGSVVGAGGGIAAVIGGGMLTAATGGLALPFLVGGAGAAALGTATTVTAEVANNVVKSECYKEVEREINEDREFYEQVTQTMTNLREIMTNNECVLSRMTQKAKNVATLVWNEIKRFVEEVMKTIECKIDIEKMTKFVMEDVAAAGGKVAVAAGLGGGTLRALAKGGGKVLGSATVVFAVFGIALDLYTMNEGVLGLDQMQDVRKIRELADKMNKFDEATSTNHFDGEMVVWESAENSEDAKCEILNRLHGHEERRLFSH